MSASDSLKPFKAQQPSAQSSGAVTAREYVATGKNLEASIGALVKFCKTALPTGLILQASLTAAQVAEYFDSTGLGIAERQWEGWAICNGSNGTPSLDGKFPRFDTAAAGGTGGSDSSAHTHAIDHNHASFTSGNESAHTHGAVEATNGTLRARVSIDGTDDLLALDMSPTGGAYTADAEADLGVGVVVASTKSCSNAAIVMGESAAGSAHSHAVDVPAIVATSGAASVTDNRPAYYELVPVMRL